MGVVVVVILAVVVVVVVVGVVVVVVVVVEALVGMVVVVVVVGVVVVVVGVVVAGVVVGAEPSASRASAGSSPCAPSWRRASTATAAAPRVTLRSERERCEVRSPRPGTPVAKLTEFNSLSPGKFSTPLPLTPSSLRIHRPTRPVLSCLVVGEVVEEVLTPK